MFKTKKNYILFVLNKKYVLLNILSKKLNLNVRLSFAKKSRNFARSRVNVQVELRTNGAVVRTERIKNLE